MQKGIKIKLLVFACIICISIKAISQEKVSLRVDSCMFYLDNVTFFEIPIVITNNEDTSILVPESPRVFNKLGMTQNEIGMEIFYENTGKKRKFDISSHYLAEPLMVTVNPKETKVITVKVPAGFFDKKETFEVIFYLLISATKQKTKYIYYHSNKFKIRIV